MKTIGRMRVPTSSAERSALRRLTTPISTISGTRAPSPSDWIAEVSGDPRVGGTVQTSFVSTWTGPGRVDVCEPPHHRLLTMEPGTADEAQIEAWLTREGDRARPVVEERGLPLDRLYFHGAGWQAQLEDRTRHRTAPLFRTRRSISTPLPHRSSSPHPRMPSPPDGHPRPRPLLPPDSHAAPSLQATAPTTRTLSS